jgi:hypothetical protein
MDRTIETVNDLPSADVARASLGYTYDNSFFAVLSSRDATLFDLKDDSISILKLSNIERTSLPLQGGGFSLPSLAIAHDSGDRWRLAWRSRNGIKVVDSRSGGPLMETSKPLLSNVENSYRLTLSSDGSFLFLQSFRFSTNAGTARVWDLRPSRSQMINSIADSAELQHLACRIAAIAPPSSEADDARSGAFTVNEMREWGVKSQPCPQAPSD